MKPVKNEKKLFINGNSRSKKFQDCWSRLNVSRAAQNLLWAACSSPLVWTKDTASQPKHVRSALPAIKKSLHWMLYVQCKGTKVKKSLYLRTNVSERFSMVNKKLI